MTEDRAAWYRAAAQNFELLGESCQAALDLAVSLARRTQALEARLGAHPAPPPAASPAPVDAGAALIAKREARRSVPPQLRPRPSVRRDAE